MNLYTQQDSNVRKTWLLMGLFLIIIVALGWIFSQIYDNPAVLYFAVAFSLLMNFFSYWYSDKIALAVTASRPIEHNQAPELYHIVENLCITAGLKTPKIYIISDPAPNAFATGRNQDNAVVAVTSGLLEKLNKTELEGVVAHELSHIGNRDILLSTIIVVLVGFVALLSDFFLRIPFFGRKNDNNNRAGVVIMLAEIIFAVLAPIAATLIQLAVSRKREFLADSSGALLTRYPEGLASALEKISRYPVSMKKTSKATAHLFIASPFRGGQATGRLTKLFMTHPPVEDRIRALREINL